MNIRITVFRAIFSRNSPLVILSHGLKLDYKKSFFTALIEGLKKFESEEKRKYPHRKIRTKQSKAFLEKTLFLLDAEGSRLPLLPTKSQPERYLLTNVGKLKSVMKAEGGRGPLLKAFLNAFSNKSDLLLRFGGNIPS